MFYAIYGKNGFGIYDNFEKVSKSKEYLSNPKIKKFDSAYAAYKEASESYNDFQEDFDSNFFGTFSDIKMNWLMFRKNIIKLNEPDSF